MFDYILTDICVYNKYLGDIDDGFSNSYSEDMTMRCRKKVVSIFNKELKESIIERKYEYIINNKDMVEMDKIDGEVVKKVEQCKDINGFYIFSKVYV